MRGIFRRRLAGTPGDGSADAPALARQKVRQKNKEAQRASPNFFWKNRRTYFSSTSSPTSIKR
jgi:hypothetical protein